METAWAYGDECCLWPTFVDDTGSEEDSTLACDAAASTIEGGHLKCMDLGPHCL